MCKHNLNLQLSRNKAANTQNSSLQNQITKLRRKIL